MLRKILKTGILTIFLTISFFVANNNADAMSCVPNGGLCTPCVDTYIRGVHRYCFRDNQVAPIISNTCVTTDASVQCVSRNTIDVAEFCGIIGGTDSPTDNHEQAVWDSGNRLIHNCFIPRSDNNPTPTCRAAGGTCRSINEEIAGGFAHGGHTYLIYIDRGIFGAYNNHRVVQLVNGTCTNNQFCINTDFGPWNSRSRPVEWFCTNTLGGVMRGCAHQTTNTTFPVYLQRVNPNFTDVRDALWGGRDGHLGKPLHDWLAFSITPGSVCDGLAWITGSRTCLTPRQIISESPEASRLVCPGVCVDPLTVTGFPFFHRGSEYVAFAPTWTVHGGVTSGLELAAMVNYASRQNTVGRVISGSNLCAGEWWCVERELRSAPAFCSHINGRWLDLGSEPEENFLYSSARSMQIPNLWTGGTVERDVDLMACYVDAELTACEVAGQDRICVPGDERGLRTPILYRCPNGHDGRAQVCIDPNERFDCGTLDTPGWQCVGGDSGIQGIYAFEANPSYPDNILAGTFRPISTATVNLPDYINECAVGRCMPTAADPRSRAINRELECCHNEILRASAAFPWLSDLIPADGIYTSSDQIRDTLEFCRTQNPPICYELSRESDRASGVRNCDIATEDARECCSGNFNTAELNMRGLDAAFSTHRDVPMDMAYIRMLDDDGNVLWHWTEEDFFGACYHYSTHQDFAAAGTCLTNIQEYEYLCRGGARVEVPWGLLTRPTTPDDLDNIDPLPDRYRNRTLADWIGVAVSSFVFPIAGILLFVMILWGGVDVVLGSAKGEPNKIEQGKKRITAAVIGFVILFSAFWIIQILESVFGLRATTP